MDTHSSLEKAESNSPASSSSGSCCCCGCCVLLFFLVFGMAVSFVIIVLVLKPKKPVFALQAIQLDTFKLNVASNKEVFVNSSMAYVAFVAENPNKFGIRYSYSEIGVLCGEVLVGVIEVPPFYQPPHSRNLTVLMHFLFERLNLSQLMNGGSLSSSSGGLHVEIQIIGKVAVRTRVLNFPLPKIKAALNCQMKVDYGATAVYRGLSFLKKHKALLLPSLPQLSQKCSLALCL